MRGKVIRSVKENYLRTDIPCGHAYCTACTSFSVSPLTEGSVSIPDADSLVKISSLLVSGPFTPQNTLILQSVLEDLHKEDARLFKKVFEIIEDNNFYVFMNNFRKETFVPQDTANRSSECLVKATHWLCLHNPSVQYLAISETQNSLASFLTGTIFIDIIPVEIPSEGNIYPDHMDKKTVSELVFQGQLFEGTLHILGTDPSKGWVTVNKHVAETIKIGISSRLLMNRALDGDTVAVECLQEKTIDEDEVNPEEVEAISLVQTRTQAVNTQSKYEGRVVSVIRSRHKEYCGSIQRTDRIIDKRNLCIFMPINQRIPQIQLFTTNPQSLEGKRLLVKVTRWSVTEELPQGHVTEILGDIEDIATESKVILLEHDVIIKSFSKKALACLPSADWTIPDSEFAKRVDFRDRPIASVDPPGCKDIDDALHCKILPNGNWEVGVHIADVTHFLEADCALDKEAAERSNTVYLVERRTDMLPGVLTEHLCSLVGHQDRLAFSVLWEIDPSDYSIRNTFFGKSVIHSKESMTYRNAQELINSESQSELAGSLRRLLELSKVLKQRRVEAGALNLASSEVKFEIDPEKLEAKDLALYQTYETNSMVEEFMLLANVSVAQKIYDSFPAYAILRRHPQPRMPQLTSFSSMLAHYGYNLDYTSSRTMEISLNTIHSSENPYLNNIVRMQVTRCMNQAVYFCSSEIDENEFVHYGLASPIYTHFTSPIRRYADVLVHRLLAAALDVKSLPESMTNRRKMSKICQRMNFMNRVSQYAQRASADLHTYLVFRGRAGTNKDVGVVSEVLDNGINVIIPKIGLESFLPLEGSKSNELEFATGNKVYKVYEMINVKIQISYAGFRKQITLTLD